MTSVHITDDHKVVVEGLEMLIGKAEHINVIGKSYSLKECRQALADQTPDVLLLDLNLPDGSGIDFCSEVRKNYPSVKILILTTHNEYSVAKQVMANGASGYILKNALSEEIISGIEAVAEGETFLCDEIDILMKKRTEQQIWLTEREKQLLELIAEGYTNPEIADKMCLSEHTVKTYRKNLIAKVGAKNTMLLVNMAKENGWV